MSSGTKRLNIRLMGAPEIHIASANPAALPLNHLKARALLFYLAAAEEPIRVITLQPSCGAKSAPAKRTIRCAPASIMCARRFRTAARNRPWSATGKCWASIPMRMVWVQGRPGVPDHIPAEARLAFLEDRDKVWWKALSSPAGR